MRHAKPSRYSATGPLPTRNRIQTGASITVPSWAANDTIIFESLPQTGLFQVSAAGGTAKSLNTMDFTSGEAANLWPATVPNTTAVLSEAGPAAGIIALSHLADLEAAGRR